MKHTIYVVVEDGIVSAVLINNNPFQTADVTSCIINHGLDDDMDMRGSISSFIQESEELTNTTIHYPDYDAVTVNVMKQLENEL